MQAGSLRSQALEHSSATAEQVEDQHDERNDDQQVDQVSTNAADETQQPQNENYDEDCPKHSRPPGFKILPDSVYKPVESRLCTNRLEFTFPMICRLEKSVCPIWNSNEKDLSLRRMGRDFVPIRQTRVIRAPFIPNANAVNFNNKCRWRSERSHRDT